MVVRSITDRLKSLDEARRRRRELYLLVVLIAVLGAALSLMGQLSLWGFIGLVAALALFLALLLRQTRRVDARQAAADSAPAEAPAVSLDTVMAVVGQMPDPFLLLDSLGRVRVSNQARHPIIANAGMGRPVSTVLRYPSVLEAINRVRQGAPAQSVEFSTVVPYDQHLVAHVAPVEVVLPEMRGSEQVAPAMERGAIVVLHDLTSMKRIEQMRADFVANASHELKTPLASLTGFIETLRGPARGDARAREKFLDIMDTQAARMRRLIDDLLSLSRIELNEHVAPDGRADLGDVVQSVVAAAGPLAAAEGVRVEVLADAGLPAVLGAQDELAQVVQNLVDNAIKYGGDGGRVEVVLARVPGDHLRLTVRDFGQGIAREHVPRLTERFYRVDAKRSRERGGTGLGLAIVKHIVSRHRGSLSIESLEGAGTSVHIDLPLANSPPEAPGAGTPERPDPAVVPLRAGVSQN